MERPGWQINGLSQIKLQGLRVHMSTLLETISGRGGVNEGCSWGPSVTEGPFALPGDTCSCQLLLPCYSPIPGEDKLLGYVLNTDPDI